MNVFIVCLVYGDGSRTIWSVHADEEAANREVQMHHERKRRGEANFRYCHAQLYPVT